MEDTELFEDTASDELETQEDDLEEDQLAETEETEETETDTEDPIAVLDADALKSHPRIKAEIEAEKKSLEARLNESFRQRQERAINEAKATEQKEAHERELSALRGEVGRNYLSNTAVQLAKVVNDRVAQWAKDDGEGEFSVPPQELAEVVRTSLATVSSSLIANTVEQAVKVFDDYRRAEYPGYKVDEEVHSKQLEAARTKDYPTLYAASTALLLKADRDSYEPQVREDERKRVLAELKAEQEAKATEETLKKNTAKPRPTNVTPTGNGNLKFTLDDIEEMPMSEWLSLGTPDQRRGWLADAHRDAERKIKTVARK